MKKFRKALAVVMCVVMTLTSAPLSGFVGMELPDGSGFKKIIESVSAAFDSFSTKAKAATYSGTCGDNLTWTFDTSTGVLNISGTGEMYNFEDGTEPWYRFKRSILQVVVENGVTTIGDGAFFDCNNLKSVYIGNGVKTIGWSAFSYCSNLETVTIPASVTDIGRWSFSCCNSLADIYYGGTEEQWSQISINDYNEVLASATIHFNVEDIPEEPTTAPVEEPTTVPVTEEPGTVPTTVPPVIPTTTVPPTTANPTTTAPAPTTTQPPVTVPPEIETETTTKAPVTEEATTVPTPSYDYSGTCGDNLIWTLNKSTGVLNISGTGAMYDYVHNAAGESAPWAGYPLMSYIKSVNIGNSVTTIGEDAFRSCDSLTSVTIPDSVTTIGEDAFGYCTSLTSIKIPSSVTTIGDYAFSFCDSLASINVDVNNKYFSSDSYGVLFNKYKATLIHYPAGNTRKSYTIPDSVTTIRDLAFQGCKSLTSVTIPDSVTTIGGGAFDYCTSLTSVTIPDSVTTIGKDVFRYCDSLTSVTIPNSVTTIGYAAFAYCDSLTSVTIPDSVTTIGLRAFEGCTSLTSIKVDADNKYYSSDSYGVLFNNNKTKLIQYPIGNTRISYVVPDSVTTIGNFAFEDCDSLTSVTIPDSVTTVGNYAFCDCDSLTSVTIPDSVTTIGNAAFAWCDSLTSITIPDSVKTIGDSAFEYCISLTSIIIPDSVTTISVYAFYGCGSLTDVYYTGTQEQWNKISIGSYNSPLTSATIHYNSTGHNNALLFATGSSWNNVKNYRYTYSDSFFNYDSTKYHHDLAMMSLALEASACVPDGGWKQDASGNWVESGDDYSQKKPANAEILLDNIGFNTRKYYGYDQQPQYESVACVIASKNISTDTTVIAVAVRGGGYEAEWGGNFNIGKDSVEHTGFDNAKLGVLKYIEDFVSQNKNSFCGNVKFWIVGYSRAAATANLVAATFDSGLPEKYKNTKALGVTKNDLYCYGFETPLNTTDKNANSATYNNIFSIANPIDPVTKVAPASKGFNFKRYGVTYYLPTQETISNYYGPNGIVSGMNAVHKKIYGEDYKENFNFLEFDLHLGVKINRSIGQMTYVNNLIDYVAVEGLKNREFYYIYIQDALMSIMAMLMGPNPDKLWDALSESLQTYIHNREFISIHPLENLKHRIALVFDKHTEIIYSDAMAMLGKLDDVLMVLVKHPNYTLTAITNHKLLFYPHYGNVLVGWMAYLETLPEAQRNKLLSPSLKYRTVKVNCPVDVNVYDCEGNLVASIIDDEVISIDGEYLSTYIDENGQKCIVLPTDEEYRVEVTAREDCDVSCTIVETDGETLTDERIVNYYEIEMDADETITCTAENSEEVDVCNYPITDSNEDEISPNEILTADEIERFNINVKSNVDGVTVFGGGEYTKGEFAQIKAYDIGCYSFAGWYVDNELLSTDNEYRFCVTEDTEITAVFNEATLNWRTPTGDLHYGETNTFLAVAQNLPEGVNIRWESSGSLFELEPSEDGRSCNITGVGFGTNSISVSLVDADGNILLDADENEIKLQQLFTVAQREFTIKWNVNGTVTRQTVAETEAIVPNVNTDVAGYVFTGWYPEVPQTMPSYDLEFTAQYELLAKQLRIKNPSVTTVNYGDTLILHADFGEVALPEGYSILWTVEGAGFDMAPADDGLTCNMTSVANGNATVKATLVDENGEAVLDAEGNEISDTQELKSNANFWQKIVSFFKNLFRINRIIPE